MMKRPIIAAFVTALMLTGICILAFYAGRSSIVQTGDCPFDFEEMDIMPKTPVTYHHIWDHAPKHRAAIPLPPRRPTV